MDGRKSGYPLYRLLIFLPHAPAFLLIQIIVSLSLNTISPGTLLDTETLSDISIFEALQVNTEIRNKLGDRLPWELKEPTLGLRGDEWVPIVLKYAKQHFNVTHPLPTWQTFWETQEAILNSMCDQVQECKGATRLVKQLAANDIPMCIATSSRMISVQQKRKHHSPIFRHMKHIVTGDMIQNAKPHPEIYLEAASRLNVDPEHCLVFEDSVAGAQAGKAAGCWVVAVPDARMQNHSPFVGMVDEILSDLTQFDMKSWGLTKGHTLN